MSKFSLGKYQITIDSDRYESEQILWNGYTCIEVKPKNNPGYSTLIFFGVMPEKATPKREMCSSKDMWPLLKLQWLPKDGMAHMCGETPNSKYETRTGWYDIIATSTTVVVRRIVRQLDGKDTLNFASKAHKDQTTDEMYKFVEEVADTTDVKKTD
jgi:hypothetical protein